MTKPLDKLTAIIARLMGKEPSDPDVLKAVVEVVMAMREPSSEMIGAAIDADIPGGQIGTAAFRESTIDEADAPVIWRAMINALLTEE